MRSFSAIILSLVLAGAAAAGEPEAIRKVLDDQVKAWNRGDLESFMAGYWKSEKLTFFSGNQRTAGWQATLDRYRKRYQADGKDMGKLAFADLAVEMLGRDAALVRGRFRLQIGNETSTGLFTLILRRLPDGWRIVHDHTSS